MGTLGPDKKKQQAFLAAIAKTPYLNHAAKAAGVARNNHYNWLKSDPTYPDRYAEAEDAGVEALELEAQRRALAGSDVLLIFLLKGAKPDKYRERREITGAGGGPLLIVTGPDKDDLPLLKGPDA